MVGLENRNSIFGPLAHLVERTHGMGEASGSSPLWSTKLKIIKKVWHLSMIFNATKRRGLCFQIQSVRLSSTGILDFVQYRLIFLNHRNVPIEEH